MNRTTDSAAPAPLNPPNSGGTWGRDRRALAAEAESSRDGPATAEWPPGDRQRAEPPLAGLSPAEKWERLAFTACKLGTTGLLAWLLTPPVFVLLAAAVAIALYTRALSLGLHRSRCVLRRPALIIAFWAVVAAADLAWLFGLLGPR